MKDSRFIELLNLHVDHQLTPAEARELDAEIRVNPTRQRTYLQYCRMQKACAQLFETERANAPARPRLARALADANRKIIAAPFRTHTRPWWRSPFAFGGLAASAACVAFVFALLKTPRQPAPAPAAVAQPAVPAPLSLAVAASQTPASAATTIQTPQPKRFRLPTITGFATGQTAHPAPLIDESVFAWTKAIELRPLGKVRVENAIWDLRRFEKPQTGASILRISGADASDALAEEMTAIEFKR